MPTASREWISGPTVGDPARCEEYRQALAAEFRRRRADGRCEGFFIRILFGPDCILDEDLESDEVATITRGVFPFVWCNYTYNPAVVSDSELAELEAAFGLRLYATAYSEYPQQAEPRSAPDADRP